MRQTPLVVAALHANAQDVRYQLYSAAYGLEMQIDNEWNAEAVLLAPHEYLRVVTDETDVTGPDTKIVSAGVTDVPLARSGEPDLSALQDARNNWLLVAGPGSTDPEETVRVKLLAALATNCRVVLCFDAIGTETLAARLRGVGGSALSRLVLAYVGAGATELPVAERAMHFAHDCLGVWPGEAWARFIVGGRIAPDSARALVAIKGISGVFMPAERYGDFGAVLDVLAALGR